MKHLIGADAIAALRARKKMLDEMQDKEQPDLLLVVLLVVLGILITICLMVM